MGVKIIKMVRKMIFKVMGLCVSNHLRPPFHQKMEGVPTRL